MPHVAALCVSEQKGRRKRPVESVIMKAASGIEGDAHAGSRHRQVSLLCARDVNALRERLPEVSAGDFGENVVISGVDVSVLGLGSLLRLGGEAVLRVSQIGKVCHNPCRIFHLTGDCIMPRRGIFATVEAGGHVRPGDAVEILRLVERQVWQAVVLTVSDRCSRKEAPDTAGPAVAALLQDSMKAHIYRTAIIPDDTGVIAQRLRHYCDGHSIDLVVTVGGTGFSPRDLTPEAARAVIDRFTPGLDEAMRAASLAKTPHAMLSRGVSGIRGSTLVVNLPGSLRAATENLAAILPALPHGLAKLRGETNDCAPRDQDDER